MMENRSFDHYLGWLPGAEGRQAGLTYVDRGGVAFDTYPLAPDYQGCGHPDPDHSFAGGRVAYADGRCDGWLRAGENDLYAIGYYTQEDLPFLAEAALSWTVCDRYFAAIMAGTYPNRIYQHAGVTDRLDNRLVQSSLPTIWDRLSGAGLRGTYYYSDVPFLALWGTKYLSRSRPYRRFLSDCASGDLLQLAFVDPRFIGESRGTSADDHPYADIRAGQSFLDEAYEAVTSSPAWPGIVLIITYDEWGGFFEHVPPEEAPDIKLEYRLRGFRVPTVIISPFARRGHVAREVYDHTSVLRLMEWRWSLEPLSIRDANARNLAEALDFSSPDPSAPEFDVPPLRAGDPCPRLTEGPPSRWDSLRAFAHQHGWD